MKVTDVLRSLRRLYSRDMPLGPKPARKIAPVRAPDDLQEFVGMWVAVKNRKVIAHASSARELATQLRSMGSARRGAVAQFVPEPAEAFRVGLG
jgi:hypothetical protein